MRFGYLIKFLLLLIISACQSNPPVLPDESEEQDDLNTHYILRLSNGITLYGDTFSYNWKFNQGFLFLSTDDVIENAPIGTLTVQFDTLYQGDILFMKSALLSKTDQRIGTALELNGRSYKLKENNGSESSFMRVVEMNENVLRIDSLKLNMTRILFHSQDEPEDITVSGEIVLLD